MAQLHDTAAPHRNGNHAEGRSHLYPPHDSLDRHVWKKASPQDVLIATYRYDAFGRRVRKVVADLDGGFGGLTGDVPAGTTDYLYSGVQCVEERNPYGGEGEDEDTPLRQYVWGRYVDELIQQKELTGGSPPTYYPLSDLLYRTVALTNGSKAIEETYDCDAYGRTLIYGAGDDWWADDAVTTNTPKCEFIFTGRRYDPETQLYFYRARYYLPELGRFASRDPLGYVNGANIYVYVGAKPVDSRDPSGAAVRDRSRPGRRPGSRGSGDPTWQNPTGACPGTGDPDPLYDKKMMAECKLRMNYHYNCEHGLYGHTNCPPVAGGHERALEYWRSQYEKYEKQYRHNEKGGGGAWVCDYYKYRVRCEDCTPGKTEAYRLAAEAACVQQIGQKAAAASGMQAAGWIETGLGGIVGIVGGVLLAKGVIVIGIALIAIGGLVAIKGIGDVKHAGKMWEASIAAADLYCRCDNANEYKW